MALRKFLAPLAVLWLGCQLAAIFAAPLVFTLRSAEASEEAVECECPGTLPGQACPMHRGHSDTRDDENTCRMQSACTTSDAALLTLSGSAAPLPTPDVIVVNQLPIVFDAAASLLVLRASTPDAPPPRA